MSLISRLLGRGAMVPAARIEPAPPAAPVAMAAEGQTFDTSARLTDLGWVNVAGGRSRVAGLPPVSPLAAQRHAVVYSCCSIIAGDLSKVPLRVMQRQADGRYAPVSLHGLTYLLNVESSPGVAASVARQAMIYAYALRGNGYAYAPRDGGGEVMLVEPVRGQQPSILRAGRDRFYDFEDGAEVRRRVPHRHMIHMRYLADDGWTGRSPIEVAAESVGIALAGQEAAARNSSGVQLRGLITMPDDYQDDEAEVRDARRIAEAIRNPNIDGFPVVRTGSKFERLDLSAADSQLLESRKFDATLLCAIYRMPPSKVQQKQYGVKANVEQESMDFLTDCLSHWGSLVEDQMSIALLTPADRAAGLVLRHDFEELLRPTRKELGEVAVRETGGPVRMIDEGRAMLGLAPLPNGEGQKLYPPPNQNGTEGKDKPGRDAPAGGDDEGDGEDD
jgi:HK97 family phage portal protein